MEFTDSRGNVVPLPANTPVTERVSGYAIVPKADTYLMIQSGNGLWHFPGGASEAGETLAETIVRECAEETGYKVAVTAPEPFYQREQGFYHTREQAFYHALQLFCFADLADDTPDQPTDAYIRPSAWMSLKDLNPANSHPTIHELLDKLRARKKPA